MPFGRAGFSFVQFDVLIRKFLHNYIHLTKFCRVRGSRVILLKTALDWIYPGSQAQAYTLILLHQRRSLPSPLLSQEWEVQDGSAWLEPLQRCRALPAGEREGEDIR